jgi:hypothetical protein
VRSLTKTLVSNAHFIAGPCLDCILMDLAYFNSLVIPKHLNIRTARVRIL